MVQAIIMAGGEGSRLRPLTCDRPKPMVPVLNRPVMEYAIELLKSHGISDIGVTLQYLPEEIINHFRDGSGHGVNLQYFIEEEPLGTAGSVKNAEEFIKDTFIVVSGDALTDFNLTKALEFHRVKGSLATLVLTPVEIPLEYGVVITEKTGEIRRFLEKPGWGELFSDTVNTGIYILEPEVLTFIPKGKKFDFSQDLFPLLLQERKPMFGVSLQGYWCDIGNHKQYQDAQFAALDGKAAVQILGDRIREKVYVGQNCRIHQSAVINGPVVIGNNCNIGPDAVIGPDVVLGDNCMIDQGASLKRTIAWSGTYIGKHAELRGAVMCNRVTIKDRAMLFEGAVIGDGGVVEENARVRPETRVWPYKTIERGTIVDKHLIWGNTACRNLFGHDGVSGKVHLNLNPECAARLGAVYGTVCGAGSTILVSSDDQKGTQMIKIAVQSGLMSVGSNVIDGGELLTPVHRYAIKAAGAQGGMHIKSSGSDPEAVHVNFFAGDGVAVSRNTERKIENLFQRDDFRRIDKQNVGGLTYLPGLTDAYIRNLCGLIDIDKVKNRRFKILISCHEGVRTPVIQLFSALGCELAGVDIPTAGLKSDIAATARQAAAEVVATGADLGAVIDKNAERLILIDEKGLIIRDEQFSAIMSLAILETSQQPVVAIPVTGSSVIETVARNKNGKVIRTKISSEGFLREVIQDGVADLQGALNQSVIMSDALSTMVKLLAYMAERGSGLRDIASQIPEIFMTQKETDCPWAAKGKVMRELMEDTGGQQVELIDGIKVYHDNGWALVLPDAELPKYHVYSEGYSYEFADSLADLYISKINQLKMK